MVTSPWMDNGSRPPPATDASPALDAGEIVRYDCSLRNAVLAMQPLAYPARRRPWILPRWDWMFLRSAERVGAAPAVWLYRDRAGVRGQRGAIMVRVQCGSAEVVAGWLVDTVVLPAARGHGIGDRLVERATRDLPIGLSLGQTEQIRALQDRHGWRHVASMRSWSLVLRPRDAFRGRISNPLARALVAWAMAIWRALCAALAAPAPRCQVRQVSRFDETHDRLWARVRSRFGCVVVRDASYLNWKYVDQPGTASRRLEVIDAAGQLRGVCVWTTRAHDRTHAYSRGWILDLVIDPTAVEDVRAVLAAVVEDARAEGVAVLEFDVLAPALEPYLRRTGWIRGSVTRHLRVAAHDLPAEGSACFAAAGSWFLTRGDSDGDHPWSTPAGREPGAPSV